MLLRLTIVTVVCTASLLAQDFRATVQGTLSDPSQAAIAGAAVLLRNVETAVERTAATDGNGYFIFQFVPLGNYTLTAKAPGFKSALQEGIKLELGANVRLDLTLQLGDAAESISVVAGVPAVQTDTSDLSTVVSGEIKDNLPLKGRSSLFMFSLTPGVVSNRYGEDTRPNDTITNVLFSANGAPVAASDVAVDGVINTVNVNRGVNISQWVPAVDSVGEFKLQTGVLPAEFGRSGGSMMNIVIKSGTNDIHGALYHFHQNSALNANNFFSRGSNQKLPAFASNNWGATIGGPVVLPKLYDGRNRTFWFFSYEASREGNGAGHSSSVPTAKMRAGDFSEVGAQIYDPFSVRNVNGVPTRDPFPEGIIPANRQDPVARRIMEFFPVANTVGSNARQPWVGNWTYSFKWPRNFDMFVAKVDQQFSEKYNMFFRMNKGDALLNFPFQFDGVATPGRNVVNRPHLGFSWGNNILLSPRLTLDFRIGYAYGKERNRPWSDGFDLASLGFPTSFTNLTQSLAFPTVNIAGFQGLAGSGFVESPGRTWTLQSNVSRVQGKHLLKLGVDFRLLYGNFFTNNQPSGQFSFNNAWTDGPRADTPTGGTGFPVASFLLGLGGGSIDTNNGVSILNKYSGVYFQDDYRVTSNLTLNLGLRYEYETPRTERFDRTTRGFDRAARSPVQVPGLDLRGGLLFAGLNGQPRGLYEPDRNNFAPRIGFAYSVARSTVIRGGYALYYVPIIGSVQPTGFSVSTPFVASQDGITPKDRLSNPFPNGLLQPIGSSQGLGTLAGQSVSFVDQSDRTPTFHLWNLNVQRELRQGVLFQVGYVGSRGINITSDAAEGSFVEQINQLNPSFLPLGSTLQQSVDNPFFGVITGASSLAGPRVQRQQLLRPFPQFLDITRTVPAIGNSVYHALQTTLETRMKKGISTIIAYTWARNISDVARIQNAYDRRSARSPSEFDAPHRLTVTVSADLPFGKGRALMGTAPRGVDLVVGGWNLATFSTFQSGFPLEFSVARSNVFAAGAGPQFPNVVGDPTQGISGAHSQRLNRYFNTEPFAQPADFTFGNAASRIASVRSPGMNNFNLTLTKEFAVTERVRFRLRGSSFNLMNHPVFSGPNTQFGTANFGKIFTQANLGRQTELALRMVF